MQILRFFGRWSLVVGRWTFGRPFGIPVSHRGPRESVDSWGEEEMRCASGHRVTALRRAISDEANANANG